MIILLDFDGTLVEDDLPYEDVTTPLRWKPYAKEALQALHAAGHLLVVWSGRAGRSLLYSPDVDPLVRAGKKTVDRARWKASFALNWSRYRQMLDFCRTEAAGLIDAIDDGAAGKFSFDLVIDDKALRLGVAPHGVGWPSIARTYGKKEENLR